MLKIREVSDMHLEFRYNTSDALALQELIQLIPPLKDDKNTVLIVAGDLATAKSPQRIVTFMENVVPRFKHTIYVLGNHEHYGCRISESEQIITTALSNAGLDQSKITVAGNTVKVVEIDGVTFYCTTMWTDYNHGNPNTALVVARYITDHRTIRMGDDSAFSVPKAAALHKEIRSDLISKLSEKLDHSRSVIVTHHLPTYKAVSDQYRKDEPAITLNAAFAANMDDVITQFQPAYWFFGHTHDSYNSKIGKTRLVCNPLGYPNEPASANNFNRTKVHSV